MTLGAQFAQTTHASGESFYYYALNQISLCSSTLEQASVKREDGCSTQSTGSITGASPDDADGVNPSAPTSHGGAFNSAASENLAPSANSYGGAFGSLDGSSPSAPTNSSSGSLIAKPLAQEGDATSHVARWATLPTIEHTTAICLAARDEQHLREIEEKLIDSGLRFCTIIESDPPLANQATAIGILPAQGEELKRIKDICRGLPLMGKR